ncbi:Vacuolar protein sorting-associated protein 53 [Umbelopsis sp. WA50703]
MPSPSESAVSPSADGDQKDSHYYDQAHALDLSPQLESKVSTILKVKDPLDAPHFDPTEYINRLFPNEQAMSSMDSVLDVLRTKLDQLGLEIKRLTTEQLDTGKDNEEELRSAKLAIEDLFVKIQDIKKKAAKSEDMVQEITQDIKSLDYAKRHLTLSITALKRLQMLVTAVGQLELMIQRRQYQDSAQLLQAVLQLLQHFKTFKSIPQIADLSKSISALQSDLNDRALKEFKSAFNVEGTVTGYANILHDVCLVVSVLGSESIKTLTDWYVDLQLKNYRVLFRQGFEVSDLENVSRRYAWLKRMLNTCDEEHSAIFPETWHVSEKICQRFCEYTSADLKEVLANKQNQIDVKELLKALQLTIEFESQLSKRFKRKIPSDSDGSVPFEFEKSISSVFEPYLGIYIEAEDSTLSAMIEEYKTSDRQLELDDSTVVLPSSTDLFYFYRETLVQSARLSTGKAFFDLCKLFGKHLDNYCANILLASLPRDDRKPLENEQVRFACYILNTADYCGITTLQLEEKLRDKIDDEWKEKVDLQEQRDNFLSAASVSIEALNKAVFGQFESAYQSMTKISWGLLETVGDQSTYVGELQNTLVNSVTIIGKTVGTKRYFRTFCDRFVEAFVLRHMANIARCRPISEVGAEQMLLDTHALKTTIMDMTFMGTEDSVAVPTTFAKLVNRGFNRIELILKTVMTPPDPVDGFIESYVFLIADKSLANFHKIMDLKGIRKVDQPQLVEAFQKRTSNVENLSESSDILTKLDLPAANALPTTISTSLNTIASTASNFNASQFQQLGIRGTAVSGSNSPVSPPGDITAKGRLNENFRKLVMTGMNFRKDLQERREIANRQSKPS